MGYPLHQKPKLCGDDRNTYNALILESLELLANSVTFSEGVDE